MQTLEPTEDTQEALVKRAPVIAIILSYLLWGGALLWGASSVFGWAQKRIHHDALTKKLNNDLKQIKVSALREEAQGMALNLSAALQAEKELGHENFVVLTSMERQASSYLKRTELTPPTPPSRNNLTESERPLTKAEKHAAILLEQAVIELKERAAEPSKSEIARSGILLARLQLAAGQTDQGRTTLRKMIAMVQDNSVCVPVYVELLSRLAVTYEEQSDLKTAQRLLEQAVAHCSGPPNLGDQTRAQLLKKDAMKSPTLDDQLLCVQELASVEEKLGQINKALALQKRANTLLTFLKVEAEEQFAEESGSDDERNSLPLEENVYY